MTTTDHALRCANPGKANRFSLLRVGGCLTCIILTGSLGAVSPPSR